MRNNEPLTVSVDDGHGPRHVTSETSGLKFTRTAFGGDKGVSCKVAAGRREFDITAGSKIEIFDERTADTVWGPGTLAAPSDVADASGEALELVGLGGAHRLQSRSDVLAPVHVLTDDWRKIDSTKGAQVSQEEKNNGTATQEVSWQKLFELETGDQGQFGNRLYQQAGLKIARIRADYDAGRTSASVEMRLLTGTDMDSLAPAALATASTGGGTLVAYIGGGGISVGDDIAGLRVKYTGDTKDVVKNNSTNKIEGGVPDKSYWFRFFNVTVCQMLKNKFGDNITSGYTNNTVLTHEVIADMVGRGMCPGLDPNKVTIETFSYAIDALAWLSGVRMGDALAQLRDTFEPDLFWTVYDDAGEFGIWDHTKPRLVIGPQHGGIALPGEENGARCNYVLVTWTDRRGRAQRTVVTTDIEELGGDPSDPGFKGIINQAEEIELPEGLGTEANAQRAGLMALQRTNNPPRAGTAVVRKPIHDYWSGVEVLPHEIMPGCVVLEEETGDDFRLTEVEYDHDARTATLTLGEPIHTEAQANARLAQLMRLRKRR